MKTLLCLLTAYLLPLTLPAQLRIGDFMAWGRDNGLPPSLYFGVYQSSDGYLWIGSSSGLVRFDGKRFKTFISDHKDPNSPSDNEISDMVEDNRKNLWICGGIQGVTRYNLRTGSFRRFPKLSQDKTPAYGVNRVLKDRSGQLWFATNGRGLARYVPSKDTFELFIPEPSKPHDGSVRHTNHITDIAEDKKDPNILWLSSFESLYSFDKRSRRFVHYPHFSKKTPEGAMLFTCIETDHENTIWLGTWYGGLMRFDPQQKQFTSYPDRRLRNPLEYAVNDIKQVNDSLLYLASFNYGLLAFNRYTGSIRSVLTTAQLPQGSSGIDIQRISVTPDAGVFAGGNYYIYQEHSAFNRMGNYIAFDQAHKTPDAPLMELMEVAYDPGRKGYWMACIDSRGLHFFDSTLTSQRVITARQKPKAGYRDVAVDRSGKVWAVCMPEGLQELNEKTGRLEVVTSLFEYDSVAKEIRQVEADAAGNIWMASKKSVYYLELHSGRILHFPFHQINPEPKVQTIYLHVDRMNNAWANTNTGLIHCDLSGKSISCILPGPSGLANPAIKSMTIDRTGHPWLGFHYSGLQVLDPKSKKVISEHTMKAGMPGMQVNSLACDRSGRIWAGFAAGLAMFDPQVKVWQLFNRHDGIQKDYADGSINATPDGRVFVSQVDGFIHFSGEMYKAGRTPPLLHITSVKANGKILYDPVPAGFDQTIELPYRTKEISIEFAAMDWLYPQRSKYFYMVENIHGENGWIPSEDAAINLAGLSPGAYTVLIYAVNGDGIKSRELRLPLIIHPPFWMRWWFIALCAAAFLAIVYALYKYRINQLQQMQQMRNNISRNLHDDIGASLTNINILNELAKRNAGNPEKATVYLVKAGEDIQRISESLSDIVWNISPRYDDLENLFIRMKRYAADMLDGKNIVAELCFPEKMQYKASMAMDQRRDFYLIFKEAVNNLAKYSGAEKALIRVELSDHQIGLVVQDFGRGFDPARSVNGNGIQNMMQRAAKWGAQLQIESRPGAGTTIRLLMKLN